MENLSVRQRWVKRNCETFALLGEMKFIVGAFCKSLFEKAFRVAFMWTLVLCCLSASVVAGRDHLLDHSGCELWWRFFVADFD